MTKDLIVASKSGDGLAFTKLTEAYKPLIDTMVDKYCGLSEGFGAERDDLRQEASLAFYRAVMTFDIGQDAVSFGLYAKICIRNGLISAIRKLKKSASSSVELTERHENDKSQKGRELPFDREELISLSEQLLSKREKAAFLMYIDGESYRDIADRLCIDEKSVDNALFRAKSKLRSHYSDH